MTKVSGMLMYGHPRHRMSNWAKGRLPKRLTDKLQRRSVLVGGQLFLASIGAMTPAELLAQGAPQITSPSNLPRPGYEARRIRSGSLIVEPEIIVGSKYDSNVFATPSDAKSDAAVEVAPHVDAVIDMRKLRVWSEAFMSMTKYLTYSTEDRTSYGLRAGSDYSINRNNSLSAGAGYVRSTEGREDPEASSSISAPLVDIEALTFDASYNLRGNRIALIPRVGFGRANYLGRTNDDRDLTTYRASVRVAMIASHRFDVFIEPYYVRRDHDGAADRSGLDRDASTIGGIGGVRVDIADRWNGEIGFGVFRSDPDDAGLQAFSSLAASGSLSWSPNARTLATLDFARGDLATVQRGAAGRIETTVNLRIEQEARHNLLIRSTVGVRATQYRGIERDQQLLAGAVEAQYLLNRHLAATASVGYVRRLADQPSERFGRMTARVGLRLVY